MATIKLPGRQMMNQNVTPARLEGNTSIGEAYKAVGAAARNLGQNIQKMGEQADKIENEGWVLKKRKEMREQFTAATTDHRANMDATTGMQNVQNKDGTFSVGKVSYQETQKKWLEDKYKEFEKDAPSDVAWASFQQKHAPNLLASISADESHVTGEKLDGLEITVHDNQDSRGSSVRQHDPAATGKSLLEHTVELTKVHDDELLGVAQEGWKAKRYNKNYERGNTITVGAFFDTSLDQKDYGAAAIGGGLLQPRFEKETLKHLNTIAGTQLGGHKFKVKRGNLNGKPTAEIVTEDGTKQFNLASGQLEDYDGTTAQYEPEQPIWNRLQPGKQKEVYTRLMKGLQARSVGQGAMVTDMMNQTKSVIFGQNGFDATSEEGLNRKAELHEANNTDMVTQQWKKDRNSAEIDAMFIIGNTTKEMSTMSPALFNQNIATLNDNIEKMAAGNPFIGKVQIDAMKTEVLRQRAQQVKEMNTEGGSYLLRHDKKSQELFANAANPKLSDGQRKEAWGTYAKHVDDKLEELGVIVSNRQTLPTDFIKQQFAALQEAFAGQDGTDHKVNEDAVAAARNIFSNLTREESARMMNKYGKSLGEPRIAVIAKMSDANAASKVLASVTTEKLNKKNGVEPITKKNRTAITSAITSESGTTELLQKTLEMEGGGSALQNSYRSLIQTHAENIMATKGGSAADAVQEATNDIMGEYDVKKFGGHYSKGTYVIPKSHIKEGGWSDKQIQETVDIIQNPTFLENNIDMEATWGPKYKEHIARVYNRYKFKQEGYKDLIKIKLDRAIFHPESQYTFGKDPINKPRLKKWAKSQDMTYDEAVKKYNDLDIQRMNMPTIEGQYIAEEKRFAPVIRHKDGTLTRAKAREGAEYNKDGMISVSPHDTGRFGIPTGGKESDRKIPGMGANRAMRGGKEPVIKEVGDE